jgi:hypothetical protein
MFLKQSPSKQLLSTNRCKTTGNACENKKNKIRPDSVLSENRLEFGSQDQRTVEK